MCKYHLFIPFFIVVFFLSACKTVYQPQTVKYKDYRINQPQPADNEITALLQPYAVITYQLQN